MKILLLRGQVPIDRNWHEIAFDNINESDDIYEHMAHLLGDERCEIAYWGKDRVKQYSDKCTVKWVKSFSNYTPDFTPDVIWARGGFAEYIPVLKKFPNAFKIYYGAGKRFIPKGFRNYNLVLADSFKQLRSLNEILNCSCRMWIKPACDSIIYPHEVEKKYDVCYIANAAQAKIKQIKWVYQTASKDLSVLHLGFRSKYKIPANIKNKRVVRKDVARQISKCRVGIIPYKKIDSAPRAMVEMFACGLPVICLPSVRYWTKKYPTICIDKTYFWDAVKDILNNREKQDYRDYYLNNLSLKKAVNHLRGLIYE